jgi:hypothetical protein
MAFQWEWRFFLYRIEGLLDDQGIGGHVSEFC